MKIYRSGSIAAAVAIAIMLATGPARAAGETCGLALENVPIDAVIRASVYWTSDDVDEAIEDEGYVFSVDEGGPASTLSIWRQPFRTYTMSPFKATGSRVVISGHKDPASTTHSEGFEAEGCVITATINSLPPWVKDYARTAFPFLTLGAAGQMLIGHFYPAVKVSGLGTAFVAAGAKILADDPIDCSTPTIARPVFATPPAVEEVDSISILANRISRNGTRTFAIVKAASTNANRASCPDFSADQRAALFTAAQNQGYRIGNHVSRLENQLNNLVGQLQQAGIVVSSYDPSFTFGDWFFNFVDPNFTDPAVDAPFLQVMTPAELDDFKNGAMGVATVDFATSTALYPDLWPDGLPFMFPALESWSASLIAREAGL